MKHNLFALGLVSLLTGLGIAQAAVADDPSASLVKSRIEANLVHNTDPRLLSSKVEIGCR